MRYQVQYPRDWEKQLRRMPTHVAAGAREQAAALAAVPRPHGCKELRPKGRGYRIRLGRNWRMLYQIDDNARVVRIERVFARGRAPY